MKSKIKATHLVLPLAAIIEYEGKFEDVRFIRAKNSFWSDYVAIGDEKKITLELK